MNTIYNFLKSGVEDLFTEYEEKTDCMASILGEVDSDTELELVGDDRPKKVGKKSFKVISIRELVDNDGVERTEEDIRYFERDLNQTRGDHSKRSSWCVANNSLNSLDNSGTERDERDSELPNENYNRPGSRISHEDGPSFPSDVPSVSEQMSADSSTLPVQDFTVNSSSNPEVNELFSDEDPQSYSADPVPHNLSRPLRNPSVSAPSDSSNLQSPSAGLRRRVRHHSAVQPNTAQSRSNLNERRSQDELDVQQVRRRSPPIIDDSIYDQCSQRYGSSISRNNPAKRYSRFGSSDRKNVYSQCFATRDGTIVCKDPSGKMNLPLPSLRPGTSMKIIITEIPGPAQYNKCPRINGQRCDN